MTDDEIVVALLMEMGVSTEAVACVGDVVVEVVGQVVGTEGRVEFERFSRAWSHCARKPGSLIFRLTVESQYLNRVCNA